LRGQQRQGLTDHEKILVELESSPVTSCIHQEPLARLLFGTIISISYEESNLLDGKN
jgi:hypothetical protein